MAIKNKKSLVEGKGSRQEAWEVKEEEVEREEEERMLFERGIDAYEFK